MRRKNKEKEISVDWENMSTNELLGALLVEMRYLNRRVKHLEENDEMVKGALQVLIDGTGILGECTIEIVKHIFAKEEYEEYLMECDEHGLEPMSFIQFYEEILSNEEDDEEESDDENIDASPIVVNYHSNNNVDLS